MAKSMVIGVRMWLQVFVVVVQCYSLTDMLSLQRLVLNLEKSFMDGSGSGVQLQAAAAARWEAEVRYSIITSNDSADYEQRDLAAMSWYP
jgi:hypothetical protein